ncbi:hypothetical protein F5Y01DRAFT_320340 [Xylaria sp. FL0043]|nr:hypothetical protein F5Y01DRAFT_320340 [Xylaria sp. FL0043]
MGTRAKTDSSINVTSSLNGFITSHRPDLASSQVYCKDGFLAQQTKIDMPVVLIIAFAPAGMTAVVTITANELGAGETAAAS